MASKRVLKRGINRTRAAENRRQLQDSLRKKDRLAMRDKRRRIAKEGHKAFTAEQGKAAIRAAIMGFREHRGDEGKQVECLNEISRILSTDSYDPDVAIDHLIELKFVDDLISQLGGGTKSAELQLQAAWCITNIASGTHQQTAHVAEACPELIQALSGTNQKLKEHAVWALGNIAADGKKLRNRIVKMGAFLPLSNLLQSKDVGLVRTTCWAISNMLKGRELTTSDEFYKHSFMKSFWGLLESKESTIYAEVCWCIAYLTSRDESGTAKIIEAGFAQRILSALDEKSPVALLIPALRTMGNMLAYNDDFNQKVLSTCKHLLNFLAVCMKHEHRGLKKEAIWVVGNILAGPKEHVEVVIKSGFLPVLLEIFQKGQFDLKREAIHALLNVAKYDEPLEFMVKQGVIPPVLSLMKVDERDTIAACIQFIEIILARNKDAVRLVEEAGGIDALETVQTHPDGSLWDRAGGIVDKYWGEDADYDDDEKETEKEKVEYPQWRLGAHTGES